MWSSIDVNLFATTYCRYEDPDNIPGAHRVTSGIVIDVNELVVDVKTYENAFARTSWVAANSVGFK
jgi:hypothetical protein